MEELNSTKGIGLMATRISRNKNIIIIALATILILMIPMVAMQFTDEVDWSPADFVIMGVLLFSTGLTFELVSRKIRTTANRVVFGIILATLFLLIWAELAVGVFGSPLAGS